MGDTFGIGKVMESIKQSTTDALTEIKPDELTDHAEERLKSIRAFRREINACLEPILEQVESVKQKFTGRSFNDNQEEQQSVD